jgi:hypothetical protein
VRCSEQPPCRTSDISEILLAIHHVTKRQRRFHAGTGAPQDVAEFDKTFYKYRPFRESHSLQKKPFAKSAPLKATSYKKNGIKS